MNFRFPEAPEREPSRFISFAGNEIDRRSENRSDNSTETALADPSARLMLLGDGRIHLKIAYGRFDPYFDIAEASALAARMDQAILLGFSNRNPVLAAPAGLTAEELPATIKAIDYRSVYIQGLLEPADLGALAQAAALLAWHASHGFCGRCGRPTEMRAGGCKRHCAACDAEHFPRTDPVAIMLTVAPEKCLLGCSPHFAPGMYSALAGFIEPGETIEAAVRRETFEEAGIRLGRVVYHASQPWPFPHSLMIGCFGEALNEDIAADTNELEDCRWFTREEVHAMLAGVHAGGLIVPPKGAIAQELIRSWAES
ncbi:NAD(+) diphosphatase [Pseudaminobacter sp. NGMCC 1.201702]|uniref:NAD(+) diphosphatase n=1 Tax=Pseudaminobacter sp. NGMCC 1.201702 TaxID=3391825 RepID=UPI0039EF92BB